MKAMEYNIEIRTNKSTAKCRVCRSNIPSGSICVFTKGTDGYNKFQLVAHADCFLAFIIREVKKFQIKSLREEMDKFTKIEKLLNYRVPKSRGKSEVKCLPPKT